MVFNLLSILEPVENLTDESIVYFPRLITTYTKMSCVMGEKQGAHITLNPSRSPQVPFLLLGVVVVGV